MTDSDNADRDVLKQAGVKDAEAIGRYGVSIANRRLEVAMQQMQREREEANQRLETAMQQMQRERAESNQRLETALQQMDRRMETALQREREEAKEFRKEFRDSMNTSHKESMQEAKEFRKELTALYDVQSRKTCDVVAIAILGGLITGCLYFAMPSEALKRLCGGSGMVLTALADVLRLYDFFGAA